MEERRKEKKETPEQKLKRQGREKSRIEKKKQRETR